MKNTMNTDNLIAIDTFKTKHEVTFLGKLLWFSLPEMEVSRADLADAFLKNSIESRYLPNEICAADAFRRASKTGELKKTELPNKCKLNLMIREVSSEKDIVIRKMVREVVDSENKRLQYQPVVTLTLDKGNLDYDVDVFSLYDEEREALQKIRTTYEVFKEKYSAQNIRSVIMDILWDCQPVAVRPSGGVYFIPEKYSPEVENLKRLVLDLGRFCIKPDQTTDFRLMPLIDVTEQRDMINKSLQEEVKVESQALIKEITDMMQTNRKVGSSTATNYINKVKTLKEKVTEYEALLETEIFSVRETMTLAQDVARKLLTQTMAG